MTPPGDEPALLIMMSTLPSAACAFSMKSCASASLVRSAGMGTILRPVSLADLRRGGFEHILAAGTDREVDALPRQHQRDALADALAAAGDEGGLVLRVEDPCEMFLLVRCSAWHTALEQYRIRSTFSNAVIPGASEARKVAARRLENARLRCDGAAALTLSMMLSETSATFRDHALETNRLGTQSCN